MAKLQRYREKSLNLHGGSFRADLRAVIPAGNPNGKLKTAQRCGTGGALGHWELGIRAPLSQCGHTNEDAIIGIYERKGIRDGAMHKKMTNSLNAKQWKLLHGKRDK